MKTGIVLGVGLFAIFIAIGTGVVLEVGDSINQEEETEFLVLAETIKCKSDPDCDVIEITPENFRELFPTTEDWNECYSVYEHYKFFIEYPTIELMTTERMNELDCYYLEVEH